MPRSTLFMSRVSKDDMVISRFKEVPGFDTDLVNLGVDNMQKKGSGTEYVVRVVD